MSKSSHILDTEFIARSVSKPQWLTHINRSGGSYMRYNVMSKQTHSLAIVATPRADKYTGNGYIYAPYNPLHMPVVGEIVAIYSLVERSNRIDAKPLWSNLNAPWRLSITHIHRVMGLV